MVNIVCIFVASLLTSVHSEDVTHYIAAEEIEWKYTSATNDTYEKAVFREYSDAKFTTRIRQPEYLGLLGPVIRVTVGDNLKVVFKNKASQPFALQTIGLINSRDGFATRTNQEPVLPGQSKEYLWSIRPSNGPGMLDPDCVTSLYYSESKTVNDINSGLIGMIIICKNEVAKTKTQINLLFGVFDESLSLYKPKENNGDLMDMSSQFFTINGFVYGNMPSINVCVDDDVILHMAGIGRSRDVHAVRLSGHSFIYKGKRQDALLILPSGTSSATFHATEIGNWLLTSQNDKFAKSGMQTIINVVKCSRQPPAINFSGSVRRYNIAIEASTNSSSKGRTRKTTSFVSYIDDSFASKAFHRQGHEYLGSVGPLITVEEGDMIKITLKNEDDFPHSIHPHGMRTHKRNEGMFYSKDADLTPVRPNELRTYYWMVPGWFGPTAYNLPCIARYYSSGVDPEQESMNGLIGPMLICQKGILDFNADMKTDGKDYFLFVTVDQRSKQTLVNGKVSRDFPILELMVDEKVRVHVILMGNGGQGLTFNIDGNPFVLDGSFKFAMTFYPGQIKSVEISTKQAGRWKIHLDNGHFIRYNVQQENRMPKVELPEPSSTMYIQISENPWNYANDKLTDQQWLTLRKGTSWGPVINKVTYHAYQSDFFFWSSGENEMGTGPTIRAHVGSTIKIMLDNAGRRPFSIYSPGVIIKTENANQTLQVQPKTTSTFLWTFPPSSGPGPADHDCVSRTYFSNVDKVRDTNSGLIGPLIICRDKAAVDKDMNSKVVGVGVIEETHSYFINETMAKVKDKVPNGDTSIQTFDKMIYCINGFAYGTNEDLMVDENGFLNLHLINIGKKFHSFRFRGATILKPSSSYRTSNSVIPLFPESSTFVRLRIDSNGDWKYEGMTYDGQENKFHAVISKRKYKGRPS